MADAQGSYTYLQQDLPPEGDWTFFCQGAQCRPHLRVTRARCVPDRAAPIGKERGTAVQRPPGRSSASCLVSGRPRARSPELVLQNPRASAYLGHRDSTDLGARLAHL